MNERIRELMEEAGLYDFVIESMGINEEMNKFAELIVRECTQSIENTIETDCITDGEKMGCEFAISDLLKHFGVEE